MTGDRRPTLAVVGATGAVGTVLRSMLSERADIWGEIRLIASKRSAGKTLTVRGESLEVLLLEPGVFDGVDVAMFDVPDEVAATWAPVAAARGAVVVDNSGAFRSHPEIPLVVPAVNPGDASRRPRSIVANPSCGTLTMIDVLAALHARWTLTSLVITTYQAASGVGQPGIDRLRQEIDAVAGKPGLGSRTGDVRREIADALEEGTGDGVAAGWPVFGAPLALNVVPWTGYEAEDGWSTDELRIRAETRRILGLPDLKVAATCVRVPVMTGHSFAVHAGFGSTVDPADAAEVLVQAPTVVVVDDPVAGDFPTPVDVVGSDPTFVGRIRQAVDFPDTLDLFLCADNLRKGAALNTAQIGELLAAELAG